MFGRVIGNVSMAATVVVLVEDEPDEAEVVVETLKELQEEIGKLHILHCSTEAEAIRHLPEAQIILLDYELPDGNGLKIMDAMREQKLAPYVIVTSGRTEYADTLMACGGNERLTKPFEQAALKQSMRRALRLP